VITKPTACPLAPGPLEEYAAGLALHRRPAARQPGVLILHPAVGEHDAQQDLPPTLSLVIGGVIIWLVVGLSVGILSATRSRSLFDRLSNVAVLIGLSLPVFVIGEVLILVVFVPLNQHGITWIQTGYAGITQGIGTWVGHMILPWITLAATEAAIYTRLIRRPAARHARRGLHPHGAV
jgi:hypothetical protein